ncbi:MULTISPECIES: sulfatase [unclassified Clostridioides]|uniref:sulfatase family protein n=1 Tax=unclassified Clostridioides TaxID=2635829 RepID=UPI001D0FF7A8|nr:sulfatase [Clostridioides sp. ZZV14-6150]MCC0660858.1 sulfatase [Clostridioides sp. ZZV14-6154]MCC0667981.1 sulfatase [Clostridioides sp. ZZV14-6153]MCC0717492.1 sulfatase [Clostridioides sp. ZZV14-6105]MCC0721380.1 sulfatase [Clostridioides sp. ZZV14-6104]MCC0725572.1 sulfatase [Clostridioides sp. ZZV14-6045]MCC0729670.1 sulfatase [Clostridioides sp. ZZV14-6048]MCC0734318.1 sulfatase [Clostridioides sp. ZZV14-6009]MCC0737961.1 sulfatase [Clostridioides sp. ZZV14-5902]MCC0742010.1 sulfa
MRVLLIDIDSLRPDHLGCYGYHRNTSPNIDEIASEGVRFSNYHCSDAPCLPSRTALMTGRFGIHTGVVNHGGVAADFRYEGINRDMEDRLSKECLPAIFRKKGMKTALISPFGERHSTWSFYAGFDEIYNTGRRGRASAEEISPTIQAWLDRNADDDDWFLYVNYWDPHTPYRAPSEYGNPFENEPLKDFYTEELLEKHMKAVGPHTSQELYSYHDNPKPEMPRALGKLTNFEDLRTFIDGYDIGIHYADYHVGKIIEKLKENGIYEDTAIIVTADHGENLGELAIYAEHATADKATTNIPMIIKWPGSRKGVEDKGLHYNLDLCPTVADIVDVDKPCIWDGESYASSIFEDIETGHDELIIGQMAHVCQRAVRFENYMYIRTYHDGYYLFPKEMLFDLEKDPYETNNIAKEHPEICKEAVYRLSNWHDEMMMTMDNQVDPLWTVIREGGPHHAKGHLKEYIKRLEVTGRGGDAVEELKRRHPYELV